MVAFQCEIIPFSQTAVCDLDHMKKKALDLTRLRLSFKTVRPGRAHLGVLA